VIDAPVGKLLVGAPMPNYEPRRYQPDASFDWPAALGPDGKAVDASCIPAFGETKSQEMAYLAELTGDWYAITNQKRGLGFGLHFERSMFRYIWYWQQLGNIGQGYPWWSRLHTVALEPWTAIRRKVWAGRREWDRRSASAGTADSYPHVRRCL